MPKPSKPKVEMTAKQKILTIFPGAVEMPDGSGAPSSDYCIVRPATKEDWPENKWVEVGPYVSGNPWEAALARLQGGINTELLKACKLALSGTTNPSIEPVLRAAIAKAEGR